MFRFFLYRFGQFLVNKLSLKSSYRLAGALSDLHYYLIPTDRKAVKNNLKYVLKQDYNLTHPTKEVFRNFGKYLVEFFKMENMVERKFVDQHVKFENLKCIDAVLKKGKGGIILTAHLGNWEFGSVLLGMMGYPLTVVALPHRQHLVNNFFNQQRSIKKDITVVPSDSAVRKCMKVLKQNGLVALVADRNFGSSCETIDFLGQKTSLPKGAALLSEKTGAGIIPTFLIRDQQDAFTLACQEPIYPLNTNSQKESILSIIKEYSTVIERKIRQYPTQWLLFKEFYIT